MGERDLDPVPLKFLVDGIVECKDVLPEVLSLLLFNRRSDGYQMPNNSIMTAINRDSLLPANCAIGWSRKSAMFNVPTSP